MEFTPPSCSLGIDNSIDPTPVSFAPPYLKEPMLAQPNLHGSKAVKIAEPMVQGTPIVISPSLDEAYSKMEQDALKHKSIGNKLLQVLIFPLSQAWMLPEVLPQGLFDRLGLCIAQNRKIVSLKLKCCYMYDRHTITVIHVISHHRP